MRFKKIVSEEREIDYEPLPIREHNDSLLLGPMSLNVNDVLLEPSVGIVSSRSDIYVNQVCQVMAPMDSVMDLEVFKNHWNIFKILTGYKKTNYNEEFPIQITVPRDSVIECLAFLKQEFLFEFQCMTYNGLMGWVSLCLTSFLERVWWAVGLVKEGETSNEFVNGWLDLFNTIGDGLFLSSIGSRSLEDLNNIVAGSSSQFRDNYYKPPNIMVDVAHGASERALETYYFYFVSFMFINSNYSVLETLCPHIMSGSIATVEQAKYLDKYIGIYRQRGKRELHLYTFAGTGKSIFHYKDINDFEKFARGVTDSEDEFLALPLLSHLRVGIGGGSMCSTRIVTGVGVPTLTSVYKIAAAIKDEKIFKDVRKPLIIADGGISSSGDVAKYLVAGAKLVMIGRLYAQCLDSAAEVVREEDGSEFVIHRGQASESYQIERYGKVRNSVAEGVSTKLPRSRCTIIDQAKRIIRGLCSAASYLGYNELITENSYHLGFNFCSSHFVYCSPSTYQMESKPLS